MVVIERRRANETPARTGELGPPHLRVNGLSRQELQPVGPPNPEDATTSTMKGCRVCATPLRRVWRTRRTLSKALAWCGRISQIEGMSTPAAAISLLGEPPIAFQVHDAL